MPIDISTLKKLVQVNIPFTMLVASYLDLFITHRLNPEIYLDAIALDNFENADFKRVGRRLKDHSLTITLHGPFEDLAPGARDRIFREATRKRLEQVLRVVPIFSPVTVVCHAGYDERRHDYYQDEWLAESTRMWTWFAKSLSGLGTRLVLENVYEKRPEQMVRLFENLSSNDVGLCFDTGHQAVFSCASMAEWLDVLGPHLQQCHLHDNCGRNDEHLAMGKGNIDFKTLFDYLRVNRPNRPVLTIEPHRKEDLWPSMHYLQQYGPFEI